MVAAGLATFLAGCGGGGGGVTTGGSTGGGTRQLGDICPAGTPAGTLNYRTTWGSSPSAASQVVQLLDANGQVIRTESLDRASQSTGQIIASSLTPGVYELRARLFAAAGGTGTELGTTSQVLDFCGTGSNTVNANTSFGTTPQAVRLNPASLTLKEQAVRRVISTVWAADGSARFVTPGSISFASSATGTATVSAAGVVTGVNAGTANITSAWAEGPLNGSMGVTVEDLVITRSKWTVLVYINAANDLFQASDLNVNQMERVANNPDVRFVVQWKQSRDQFPSSSFDGVRRYAVKYDTTGNIASELVQNNMVNGLGQPLDMGDPQTLNDFITWGKANYPADRYCLVVWNHGNGWKRSNLEEGGTRGFSYDDEYGTSIQTWEIDEALGSNVFDILAWDASLMQMVEVAYEARNRARYVVGSEESPPADGYPYDAVFDGFRDNPDALTADLTLGFVEAMVNHPPYATRKITQSVIDTSRLPALATAVDILAANLIAQEANLQTIAPLIRANAQAYSPNSTRVYRDLIDICTRLNAEAGTPAPVKAAATNVITAANNAIIHEGHNNQSAGSRGVSIDFMGKDLYPSLRPDYERLKWAADTRWNEWLAVAP